MTLAEADIELAASKPQIVDLARAAVVACVGENYRHLYAGGRMDHHAAIRAAARAIVIERSRAAAAAHEWMHDNGLGSNAANVALVILGWKS